MTEGNWLVSHPYLRPVAEFHSQAAAILPPVLACIPNCNDYGSDYLTWRTAAAR